MWLDTVDDTVTPSLTQSQCSDIKFIFCKAESQKTAAVM